MKKTNQKQTKITTPLENHLKSTGITQIFISRGTNIPPMRVNRIVKGSAPSYHEAVKISEVLNMDPHSLFPSEVSQMQSTQSKQANA